MTNSPKTWFSNVNKRLIIPRQNTLYASVVHSLRKDGKGYKGSLNKELYRTKAPTLLFFSSILFFWGRSKRATTTITNYNTTNFSSSENPMLPPEDHAVPIASWCDHGQTRLCQLPTRWRNSVVTLKARDSKESQNSKYSSHERSTVPHDGPGKIPPCHGGDHGPRERGPCPSRKI